MDYDDEIYIYIYIYIYGAYTDIFCFVLFTIDVGE